MSTYKHEMDKLKLSEQGKKRMLALYSSEVKKEEHNMMKFVKPVVAVAACAAILVGYTVSGNLAVREQSSPDSKAVQTADDHEFTMTVYAEELNDKNPVIAYNGGEICHGWAICGGEDGSVSYSMATDFACEGEGIESVTYQINKGAFQIFKPESTKLDIKMKEVPYINTPIGNYPHIAGNDESLSDEERAESEGVDGYYVSEYTLDYANQKPENVVFNICGEEKMNPDIMFGNQTPEGQKAGMDELLGDVVITCIVTFTDGTSVSKEIVMENKIMTRKEAEPEAVAHDSELQEHEELANEKTNYLFFKMK